MPKTPEEIAAEQQAAADKAAADKAAQEAANGFPAETPLDQMTVEQREAYWKFQARKHEGTVKSRADYDDLKAKADELETLKAASATQAEKDLEEARRQGENIGAGRYLKAAVEGRFQALTGKSDEEIATIFAHADAQSFTDDQGLIDTEKLKSYAATFGTKDAQQQQLPHDPVAAAIAAQRQAAGGGNTGSIAEMQRQRVEELKSKGK